MREGRDNPLGYSSIDLLIALSIVFDFSQWELKERTVDTLSANEH